MKTKFQLVALLMVMLICPATLLQAQEVHVVTLNVNTGEINNNNVNDVSDFGQSADISNRDFTIEVSLGDIVVWKGVSTSPENDSVMIDAINHEGGARVFDRNTLKDDPQNPGVVVGKVTAGRRGDEEKYKISFKVFENGVQKGGTYHIDPKIRIIR